MRYFSNLVLHLPDLADDADMLREEEKSACVISDYTENVASDDKKIFVLPPLPPALWGVPVCSQHAICGTKICSPQSFQSRKGNQSYDTFINLTLGVTKVQLIFLQSDKER